MIALAGQHGRRPRCRRRAGLARRPGSHECRCARSVSRHRCRPAARAPHARRDAGRARVRLARKRALLYRSVDGLLATAPGFDDEGVSRCKSSRRAAVRLAGSARAVLRAGLDAVRGLPGVVDAAFTSQLPLSGESDAYGVAFESEQRANDRGSGAALRYVVTPDWFRTMRIPLVEGRLLGVDDRADAQQAVLINESFAKRRFGTRSPLGQRLRMGPYLSRPDGPWATIVGVVGDVKQTSLALDSPDAGISRWGSGSGWTSFSRWRSVRAPIQPRSRRASASDLVRRPDAAARARHDDEGAGRRVRDPEELRARGLCGLRADGRCACRRGPVWRHGAQRRGARARARRAGRARRVAAARRSARRPAGDDARRDRNSARRTRCRGRDPRVCRRCCSA